MGATARPAIGPLLACWASWLVLMAGLAHGMAPELSRVYPSGGQRGTDLVVRCEGKFPWPVRVVAPGITVVPQTESGNLRVSIPANVPSDRVWIRLFNEQGASQAVPFLIGSLAEVGEEEPNDRTANAQHVAAPVTVNGRLQAGGDVDLFTVPLDKGETLVAALDAHTRLGSPMDAVVQIVGPDGFVVADNHDDLGLDPRLAYRAVKKGQHAVRVFAFASTPDTRIEFHGGNDYVYRLTVTTGPYVTHCFPLAVTKSPEQEAARPEVEPQGWNIPPGVKEPVVRFGGQTSEAVEWPATGDGFPSADDQFGFVGPMPFGGSARVLLVAHPSLAMTAAPPAEGLPLVTPVSVTGCLQDTGQTHAFRLICRSQRPIVLAVDAQRLGLPTVPHVRILDSTYQVVAESSVGAARQDVLLRFTAKSDGVYRVELSDRFGRGGDRFYYRMTVRDSQADFSLAVTDGRLSVAPGETVEIPVSVTRVTGAGEKVGKIRVAIEGLPDKVIVEPVVSDPQDDTAKKVSVKVSGGATPFQGPIRIVGRTDSPRPLVRTARTPERLGATFDTLWCTIRPDGGQR